jgi:hypothetical protein
MESLSENAPDAGDVLASFGRKRRTARNRMYAASGGLAVAVVVVVVGVLLPGVGGTGTGGGYSAESSPAGGLAVPAAAPTAGSPGYGMAGAGSSNRSASGASSAASCGTVRLKADLAEAVRKGASVIVGYGTVASGSAAVHGAGGDAPAYYSLTLHSVQTLAGPTVTSGSIAWIAQTSTGSSASADTAQTFLQRGEMFGVVSPSAGPGAPGPVLQAAPVSNGEVLLRGAACWDVTVSPPLLAQGSADLNGPLGPSATEVPLATAEKLAAQSK